MKNRKNSENGISTSQSHVHVPIVNVFMCIAHGLLCVAFTKGEAISDFQSDQEISQVS